MNSRFLVPGLVVSAVMLSACADELQHQQLTAAQVPYAYDAPAGAEVSHERFKRQRLGTTFYVTEVATSEDFTLIAMIDTPANRVLVKTSPAEDANNFIHQRTVSWTGPETTRTSGAGVMQVQPYRIDNDSTACVAAQTFSEPTFDDSPRELYHESVIAVRCQEGTEPVSQAEINDMLARLSLQGS